MTASYVLPALRAGEEVKLASPAYAEDIALLVRALE